MIDPKVLRQDMARVKEMLANRKTQCDLDQWISLESERKDIQTNTQNLQNQRNELSKTIGQRKAKGEGVEDILEQVNGIKSELDAAEAKLNTLLERQNHIQLTIPNLLHESVPVGKTEADNQVLRTWGTPRVFDFEPKDHTELTESAGLIDFNTASKISGSRFVVMRGSIAKLHRALIQFMLNTHIESGYQEIYVPYLVERDALLGAGQLPKFAEDLFHIAGDKQLSLIPTAEVPLTNLVRDSILDKNQLPMKFVCHSPCFRSEAGSYGKDTKGMIRQHQFEKVELVQVVEPEKSYEALDSLTQQAESILQKLELPYQVVALCSADVGFCAAKTYDLEVWLPSQQKYREISSCSNTENFQSRRLQARYRPEAQAKPEYVHLLNGSGLAVGRTLIAIIENYQDKSGDITIPAVLKPYMNGLDKISTK